MMQILPFNTIEEASAAYPNYRLAGKEKNRTFNQTEYLRLSQLRVTFQNFN